MSKNVDDEVFESNRKLLDIAEESFDDSKDCDDDIDNSGKLLDTHYAYYDVLHQTWREILKCSDKHQAPICEYLTIYNFADFIDTL